MFLIFGKSEARRSYKHGSYKIKSVLEIDVTRLISAASSSLISIWLIFALFWPTKTRVTEGRTDRLTDTHSYRTVSLSMHGQSVLA